MTMQSARAATTGPAIAPSLAAQAAGYFGVAGLDDLTPQGLSYDTQIMVEGDTGIGKSVLATQFLYEGLVVGDYCVYVACDEPPDVFRRNMANFRLGTAAYERAGQFVLVDAYARERSAERYVILDPTNLDEFFLNEMRVLQRNEGRRTRLVVDSLSTLLITAEPQDVVEFVATRLRFLRRAGVFAFDNVVRGTLDEQLLNRMRHAYPALVNMRYAQSDGRVLRLIQLGKLRSGQFVAEPLQFSIDPRSGIVIQQRGA